MLETLVRLIGSALLLAGPGVALALWGAGRPRAFSRDAVGSGEPDLAGGKSALASGDTDLASLPREAAAREADSLRWLEAPLLAAAVWIALFWWLRELPIGWLGPVVAIAVASWLAAFRLLWTRAAPPPGIASACVAAIAIATAALLGCSTRVPPGVDAAMHAAMARIISDAAGHPRSYRPFWPLDFFHTYPVGQPTLVALLRSISGLPMRVAALAGHAATYGLVICSFAVAIGRRSRRPALGAVVGAAAVLIARSPLYFWTWGGAPNALGIAFALLAFTEALELAKPSAAANSDGPLSAATSSDRPPSAATSSGGLRPIRSIILCALCAAAALLTHAVAPVALAWAFAVLAILSGLSRARTALAGGVVHLAASGLRLAAAASLALLLCTPWLAHLQRVLSPAESAWIAESARAFSGGTLLGAMRIFPQQLHDVPLLLGAAAFAFLLWKKPARARLPLALALVLVALTVAGARQWLPGSSLLYPERVAVLLLYPLALACAEAIAVATDLFAAPLSHALEESHSSAQPLGGAQPLVVAQPISDVQRHPRARRAIFTSALLAAGLALAVHALILQRKLLQAGREHALVTAEDEALLPRIDALPAGCSVATNYGDAGQWLPALAGRPITFPQIHVLWLDEVDATVHPCAALRGAVRPYDVDLIGPLCAHPGRCRILEEKGAAQLFEVLDPSLQIKTRGFVRPEIVGTPTIPPAP